MDIQYKRAANLVVNTGDDKQFEVVEKFTVDEDYCSIIGGDDGYYRIFCVIIRDKCTGECYRLIAYVSQFDTIDMINKSYLNAPVQLVRVTSEPKTITVWSDSTGRHFHRDMKLFKFDD